MVEWLHLQKGQKQGPVTSESLKTLAGQGVVMPWTPVKRLNEDGASEWRRAGEVKGLFAGDVANQLGDAICHECGKLLDQRRQCLDCSQFESVEFVPTAAAQPPAFVPVEQARKEYKVLTQKDKWFTGKFDPEKLEEALNAYAGQGWVVKAAATAAINGMLGGNRDELIVILER